MFGTDSDIHTYDILPGVKIKTLVYGSNSLMSKFTLKANSIVPSHTHPFEQTGYLLAGKLKLTVGSSTQTFNPGDSWCIESGTEHSAVAFEDSVALEVFTPAREDYLKYLTSEDIVN